MIGRRSTTRYAIARSHGLKVIATLGNQWGDCEDGAYKSATWYESGYKGAYRAWVREVVTRYRDDPTIAMWQLLNEAETSSASTLRAFAADMGGLVKSIDTNHLVSLGTIGSGQAGASGDDYKTVHDVAGIDVCEYHDYGSTAAMPGDQWNGLQRRIDQCRALGKPIFIGETGVPRSVGLSMRATVIDAKLDTQLAAGVAGVLVWEWRNSDQTGGDEYVVTTNDPLLTVMRDH